MENPQKRAAAADAIRGFSLLGILMSNMLIFQYGVFGKDELHLFNPSSWDLIGHDMLKIFVEGSFMPIFAFLFGYSMIKMKESINAKGLKYGRNVVRRSLLLIGLGFLHSYLLWEGDILLFYGAISFFLLLFVNRKPKTLMIWGSIFLLLSVGISYGPSVSSPEDAQRLVSYVNETINLYDTGTYSEIMYHRMNSDPLGLPGWMMIFVIILAPLFFASLFLLGMAAGKRGRFLSPRKEKGLYLRYAVMFVPTGIAMKTAAVTLGTSHTWSALLLTAGGHILALGYIYLFAYMYAHSSKRSVIVRSFEAVGRMSLTNYLMQTVICVLIFYGYGFGMFGRFGVIPGILLALGIYAAQAGCSLFILNQFHSGPVERLLRIGTYWSWSGQAKPKRQTTPKVQAPKIR